MKFEIAEIQDGLLEFQLAEIWVAKSDSVK